MVSEIKSLLDWTSGETHQITEEISQTQNKFVELNENLSAESNCVGQIQDKMAQLDNEMMSFRNKAQKLSKKLETLKKKIHSGI